MFNTLFYYLKFEKTRMKQITFSFFHLPKIFYILMFRQVGNEKDIIIYVLGVLSAVCTQVVSYYFGSSQGSANKQNQIDKLIK